MSASIDHQPGYEQAIAVISPEQYRALLQAVRLIDVNLEALEAFVDRSKLAGQTNMRLDVTREFAVDVANPAEPRLQLIYLLRVRGDGKAVVRINATYSVHFKTDQELPPEFFVIYGRNTADMQVWPYLRELAGGLSLRMGIPAIALPLLTDPKLLDRTRRKRKERAE